MAEPKELTAGNYDQLVTRATKTVVVDFWATWCGPCRMMAAVVQDLANKHPEIDVYKCNVDEESQIAANFDVASIPTLVVFKNGKEVTRTVGAMTMDTLMSKISNYL